MKTLYIAFTSIFLIFFIQHQLFATKITGRVTDSQGEGLEFATIFVKENQLGTTTNELGEYELNLRAGNYTLIFQYVGYKTKNIEIPVSDEPQLIDIVLEPEFLTLEEVVVEASDKDPAYAIIRQAQRKRRFYLKEEVKSYQCKVYVKGLQRLDEKPKRIMGIKVDVDTGIVYFSESLSKLSYKAPNKYNETIVASKVSGDNRGFSFNQASDAWLNLYENISGKEINERGLVSPIASNALLFYRYRLVGVFYENGLLINKIKLIPKRKFAPAYSGFVYIVEDTWRIHSVDLTLDKGVIEFVDGVSIKQNYAPISKDSITVWLPLSQKIKFNIKAFGFKGNGYFLFSYSDFKVEPNFPKKHFKADMITVLPESNKKDSIFWKEVRPIPLTQIEVKDYRDKDSIRIIKESPAYKDSVDTQRNKISIGEILWAGYTYRKSAKKKTFSFQPIFSTFQYNTVEGLVTDLTLNYRKRYEDRRSFSISPTLRYGFSNEKFHAKLRAVYNFKPISSAYIAIEGGQYIQQLSRTNSITPFVNTVYTLFDEQNFMKLYQKAYGKVQFGGRVMNGLRLYSTIEYAERTPLENTSDYRFREVRDRVFTSNTPFIDENTSIEFGINQAMTFGLVALINFGQKYAVYPNRKFVMESKYPTIRINYRKGLNILGSDVNYDFLTLGLSDNISLGSLGTSSFSAEFGTFLNKEQMTFVDFRHFLGNQTIFIREGLGSFQLLDYYQYSTNDDYIKGHFTHHFNGALWNNLPLLKKLRWQIVASANYLYTERSNHYLELSAGIEHIFKILRVDFVTALQEGQRFNTGFRFGFGF